MAKRHRKGFVLRIRVEDTAPYPGETPGNRQSRGYPRGDPHTGSDDFDVTFRKGMERLSGVKYLGGNNHWWVRETDRLLVIFDWRFIGADHNNDEGSSSDVDLIYGGRRPAHRFLSRYEESIITWRDNIIEAMDVARAAYNKAFFRLWTKIREMFPSNGIEEINLVSLRFRLSNLSQKKKASRERRLAGFTARLNQIKRDPRPYLKGKRIPSSVPHSGIVIATHKQFEHIVQSVTIEKRQVKRVIKVGKRRHTIRLNEIVAVQRWYRGGKVTTARVVWTK